MAGNQFNAFSNAKSQSSVSYDAGLRSFMLRTYNYMALGVAFTGIITLFLSTNPALMQAIALGPAKWVIFIALLGLGWFAPKLIYTGSRAMAHICFWAYAGLWGILIAPMIFSFLQVPGGAADIARAFFITAGMFAGTSIFGYTTKKNLGGLSRFFMMAVIGLLIAMVVNIFVASSGFSLLISVGAVLIFAGLTAYETQMLKVQYDQMRNSPIVERLSIFGAFTLYGSFVTMFIHILNIMAIMRNE